MDKTILRQIDVWSMSIQGFLLSGKTWIVELLSEIKRIFIQEMDFKTISKLTYFPLLCWLSNLDNEQDINVSIGTPLGINPGLIRG